MCNRRVRTLNIAFDSLMFIYILFSMFIVIFYSNASYVIEYPKLIIYIYGFLFTKLCVIDKRLNLFFNKINFFVLKFNLKFQLKGLLQLAHLANAVFMQFRRSLILCTFIPAFLSLLNYRYKYSLIH